MGWREPLRAMSRESQNVDRTQGSPSMTFSWLKWCNSGIAGDPDKVTWLRIQQKEDCDYHLSHPVLLSLCRHHEATQYTLAVSLLGKYTESHYCRSRSHICRLRAWTSDVTGTFIFHPFNTYLERKREGTTRQGEAWLHSALFMLYQS